MGAVNLLYRRGANAAGSPVALVYGASGSAGSGSVELRASGVLTGLRGRIKLRPGARLVAGGVLTGLRGAIRIGYDANVDRTATTLTRGRWQEGGSALALAGQHYQEAARIGAPLGVRWQGAVSMDALLEGRWQDAPRLDSLVALRDQGARGLGVLLGGRFDEAGRLQRLLDFREQHGRNVSADVLQLFEEAVRLRAQALQRFQEALGLSACARGRFGEGFAGRLRSVALHWQDGRQPPAGTRGVPRGSDPCYVPQLPVSLIFRHAWDGSLPARLVYVCRRHSGGPGPQPGETIVVPVQRTYIVINNITLHRVDTGAELRAITFGMSLDRSSWTWQWQATLHASAGAHLGRDSAGEPAELAVEVNGVAFRLRLEGRRKDERFLPDVRYSVGGRGKAAVLGQGIAPEMSFANLTARTAQQLAADVLTVNGVPLGWNVEWGLTDWLVPAGAWVFRGAYIDAINDIAQAGGGYVQPHATADSLRVLPLYPAMPSDWGGVTPDFEIPADAAEVIATEFVDKPTYNRVFVGGLGAGVFGPWTRRGTAGDRIAPPVSHALITHADAQRQRAMAVLGDTGKQALVSLRMQVRPDTGVIVPGQFVRHGGVVGLVRSTAIDWQRPTLRQVIQMETHDA